MAEVGERFFASGDAVGLGGRRLSETGELWKDVPDPVRTFASVPDLVERGLVAGKVRVLSRDEPVEASYAIFASRGASVKGVMSCITSPCWLRSSPIASCSSETRRGMIVSVIR